MSVMTSHHVLLAAEGLRHIAVRTPMIHSAAVDAAFGRRVLIKAENLQRTGSFKFRGAHYALSALSPGERRRGVVAASSGNHAQALALAAHLLKAPATVVIPADTPTVKVEAIEALGARIIRYDRHGERRDMIVHHLAYRDGLTIIPSANHASVIAGAGTVAWEMLQEAPDLAAILVPVGGGGLAAGTALAASAHGSNVAVVGVEPEGADDTRRSLHVGRIISIPTVSTIADGLRHNAPAPLPFDINRRLLADVVTVTEEQIGDAMATLWRHYRTAAEPSGATAFAGLHSAADQLPDGPIGVILSGGNADWSTYRMLLDLSMERMSHVPVLH
ncbi:threonine/serine dehydratase [Streptomyces sp. NPDC006703]|uniref:threonine ammonia-lyase n=1 Tax=Streptomyces sp. NPDC006703 TaxID=3364759 RepID=UPI0036A4DCC9